MKIVKNVAFPFSPKLTIFGIFNELLSTQNVNVARFARNVECDFFGIFKLCVIGFTHLSPEALQYTKYN